MTSAIRQITAPWNGGNRRLVAIVRPVHAELSDRFGLSWQHDHDNLDDYEYVIIEAPSGRVFALRRYPHDPAPGIDVIVDLDHGTAAGLLDEALAAIGLSRADVTWLSPDPGLS